MTSGFFNALTPPAGGIGRSTRRRVAADSSAPTPSAMQALIPLALLGAFAGSASAQSSVTLFGIVDTGVRAVKNGDGGTVKSLTSNGLSTSRLGFRGVEDMGGGLKAGFWLESEIAADTGTVGSIAGTFANNTATSAAKFFNRRSTISLMGPFGEARLGRDYVPTYTNLATFDAYGAVGVGSILNIIGTSTTGTLGSSAGTLQRADNAIQYFLPANLGGLYGSIMAAAGEGNTTASGNNRYVGGRVGYATGPLEAAGAYSRTRIPGSDDLRVWNAGASFKLGVAKLSALYHRGDHDPSGLPARRQKVWAVGANVSIGQGEIRATYQRSDVGGGTVVGLRDQDDARLYAVGYIHNLSKRTAFYADLGRLQNRGRSQLTIPGGTLAGSNFGTVDNRDSTALALGVRHSF